MPMIALRYDLRTPSFGAPHAALYRAALDQAQWADEVGLDAIVVSEHHGTDDGYLPAPLVFAAAVAGRTKRIAMTIAALLVPLHDPLRLAEQLLVLDHVSGGRMSFVAGQGYRPEEFVAAGVDRSKRGALLEEYVRVLQQAWTGEPFEYRGATVQVTPKPVTPGGPMMFVGGSTEIAAKRAARLGCAFYPATDDPAVIAAYNAENERLGNPPGFAFLPGGPIALFVSDDPERDWEIVGPHAVHDAVTYASWQPSDQKSVVDSAASNLDELRAEGKYLVLRPEECIELIGSFGDMDTVVLHPLLGGLDPDVSWEFLRRFEREVLPKVKHA